jgi:multicomponent K+:H+ antiporter subunit A/multicomponent Na+:H+ antiporter subunit A
MSPQACLLVAVFLPMLASLPVAMAGRRWGRRTAWLALIFPVVSFVAMLTLAGSHEGVGRVMSWAWVPTLGLELAFLVDGLSLLFALIVSGMGVLVVFYAAFYLDDHYAHQGRFYAYLLLFMAAMLGTVLSDNLLLLFIFWELTGLTSFLLIGFLHGDEGSRNGARMAILVTGGTGLVGLAGIVLLRQIGGTLSLRELLSQPGVVEHPLAGVAMLLLLVGAFGKSAQFPFHFWLPNAMSAPTPVSAYLHSATMVKLGVFLTARLFPIFQSHPYWSVLVSTVAFVTLVLAGLLALLSNELKAILAYSTVSQLGFLIGYYGLGPAEGVEYDYLHLLNHVFYKGSLFMVVGVIYVATHAKDIRELGGLWRRMPLLGVIMAVACAAMLGLPGTTGFLSKELMFKEIFVSPRAHGWLGVLAVVSVVMTSLMKVAFSVRLFSGVFLGRESEVVREGFHAPPAWLLLPPGLLALAALVFGVMPEPLAALMHHFRVEGLHTVETPVLHLWHGVTRELLASVGVVLGGVGVAVVGAWTAWRWARVPRMLRWDAAFEGGVYGLGTVAKATTRWQGADAPNVWLRIMMGFLVLLIGGYLVTHFPLGMALDLLRSGWSEHRWDGLRVLVAGLVALGALGAIVLRTWPGQLISLSVSGFLLTLYFVLYRAPDLALTQILVDTVTLLLVVTLLARYPKSAQAGEDVERRRRWPQAATAGVLAVGFGVVMTALGLLVTARMHERPIGPWFVEHAVPLAEGSNVVNTILVDFRGFDTLGEIAVLVIAMMGCLGLMFRRRRTREEFQAGAVGPAGLGVEHEPEGQGGKG